MEQMLIDISMMGLDGGMPRVYKRIAPTILSRIFKEPSRILEIIKIGVAMNETKNTIVRAEQSRAEQSRAFGLAMYITMRNSLVAIMVDMFGIKKALCPQSSVVHQQVNSV